MAERAQSPKRAMEHKPQRDIAGNVGERHGGQHNSQQDRQLGVKPGGTVGREVPDENKEHHTEIAVEAGHKGQHRDDKR